MKGPSGRLTHVVKRHWECPRCQRRARTEGNVVNLACSCTLPDDPAHHPWMMLIEEPARLVKATHEVHSDPTPPPGP